MMDENGDALVVVRWCWPCCEWAQAPEIEGERAARHVVDLPSCRRGHPMGDYSLSSRDFYGVHCAERVLLARGLAEQYGRALLGDGDVRTGSCNEGDCAIDYESVAQFATAPLASRLRALARVARENPNWSGHPVDVTKALLRDMGETLSPEAEAAMRAACDAEAENPEAR